MDILIKKEVLENWDIRTEDLLISPANGQVYQITANNEIEQLTLIKYELENNTIILSMDEVK